MDSHVFVGGTFEGVHKGHTAMLSQAFKQGKIVTIGLTSDEFVKKLKKTNVSDFGSRKRALSHLYPEARIIPIDDVHEPAASMPDLDAIVVSSETLFRAKEINDLRKKRNLKALSIVEVPMVAAQDKKPISSTRVRDGEIDRDGRLVMPDSMRDELGQPLSIVLSGSRIDEGIQNHQKDLIITVGDIATETLIGHGVMPSLAIIDQKVGRKPYDSLSRLPKTLLRARKNVSSYSSIFKATPYKWRQINIKSGPGYISQEAIEAIKTWAKNPKTLLLIVDGEEDLLALPAIVHAPIGGIVYYGQPGEGLVEVIVTKEKKQEALALLGRFN